MNYRLPAYRELDDGELLEGMGYDIVIRRRTVGQLQARCGELVACDLLDHPDTEPFALTLPVGSHPVRLIMAELRDETVIAYASLELGAAPATRWRVAAVHGEQEQGSGFSVSSGVACFMDAQAAAQLIQYTTLVPADEHELWRALRAQFKKVRKRHRGHTAAAWAELVHEALGPSNIIAFSSGHGPGLYTTWLGEDDQGQLTRVVIDFHVLKLRFTTLSRPSPAPHGQFVPT